MKEKTLCTNVERSNIARKKRKSAVQHEEGMNHLKAHYIRRDRKNAQMVKRIVVGMAMLEEDGTGSGASQIVRFLVTGSPQNEEELYSGGTQKVGSKIP